MRSLHITAELLSEPGLSPNYLWAHKGFRSTLQRGARAELVVARWDGRGRWIERMDYGFFKKESMGFR